MTLLNRAYAMLHALREISLIYTYDMTHLIQYNGTYVYSASKNLATNSWGR